MNEVGGLTKEAVRRVEQIAGHLRHPGAVRVDSDSCDLYGARPELDDEEDHDADGAEDAQRLDGEEVAGIQRFPVARDELLPGPLFGIAPARARCRRPRGCWRPWYVRFRS